MPLHIDHRPKSLEEIAGEANASAVKVLDTFLSQEPGRIPHAFLFTGKSGCGKTTLARIVASRLGCHPRDFVEMDSAQFRGIDTIRDLRKQAQLRPMAGPCRVWLLDECHQLSRDAQDGLLKLLEDTPPHVWLCLATTEPKSLKPALLGRCTRIDLQPLDVREMARFLKTAAAREGAAIGTDVIKVLAKSAEGSPRAGLVGLERVLNLPEEDRLAAAAQTSEGMESEVRDLCRALLAKSRWPKLRDILGNLQKEDPEQVRRAVLGYANAVLLGGDDVVAAVLLECFETPTWDAGGWPAITLACYRAFVELND